MIGSLRILSDDRSAPVPIVTLTLHRGEMTVDARLWEPGDTFRCRSCPTCTADHRTGLCLVASPRLEPT